MNDNCKNCQLDLIGNGQAACAGCTMDPIIRTVIMQAPQPEHVVVIGASGCNIVARTIYPFTADRFNSTHLIFETTGGALTGTQAAIEWQKSQGLIPEGVDIRVIGFAGDGATSDIGLASLLCWLERGDPGLYVCYDNNGFQNTGTQSSGTAPKGAHTTTTPHGFLTSPNAQGKDLMRLALCQPATAYAAMTTISTRWPNDLEHKAKEAFDSNGPAFLHVISPCPRGWGYPADLARHMGDIGIETGVIPLYHVKKVGKRHLWYLDYLPDRYVEYWNGGKISDDIHPIVEWVQSQGRFKDLLADPEKIRNYQENVDLKWEELKKMCEPYGS
ncbi:MAG: thiamine pyrophosphate-dependent enzyme [Candidatus Paceibacterota bacterium]|jgi:pyruvate ferredoxin oxidoreductase beta subunit